MGEFRDLTPEEAENRFRQFLAERPAALEALAARATSAGLTLDHSLSSLQPLWEWIVPQLDRRSRFERRRRHPTWLVEGHPADALNSDSVDLLDGFVSYLGVVFTAQTGLAWELETRDSRSLTHQNMVFAGGMFVPIGLLNRALRHVADTGEADDETMDWVAAAVANTNASRSADRVAHTLDVAVEPCDLPEFNWEIWVDEEAELVLGREAFDSLEGRFSIIPQVTDVVHEDREIYLIQAENITAEELEAAIRSAVDRAMPA